MLTNAERVERNYFDTHVLAPAYAMGDRLLYRTEPMLRGDDVRELQRRLGQLGFDAGKPRHIYIRGFFDLFVGCVGGGVAQVGADGFAQERDRAGTVCVRQGAAGRRVWLPTGSRLGMGADSSSNRLNNN